MISLPTRAAVLAVLTVALLVSPAGAQTRQLASARLPRLPLESPGEHPLKPLLRFAESEYEYLRDHIRDYTCLMVKRERFNGKMSPFEYMKAKIRHRRGGKGGKGTRHAPFSVFLKWLGPSRIKGREVAYVTGRNNGKLIARRGGSSFSVALTLDPNSRLALRNSHYPVTEIGIENLVKRLIQVAKEDLRHGECSVRYIKGVRLNKRECTCIEVVHPIQRKHFRYHAARIYVDEELRLPIRFEAYQWPKKKGGRPILVQEYTYLNLKTNVGLTDKDFFIPLRNKRK